MLNTYLIPETMARQPAAIYLSKNSTSTDSMTVALAFEGHKQVLKVMGEPPNLFFTHCRPCVAFQDRSCPGGSNFLGQYDDHSNSVTIQHPIAGNLRHVVPARQCIKHLRGERIRTYRAEITVEVNLPDYIMAAGYSSPHLESGINMFVLDSHLIDESNPETMWYATPLRFPNIYSSGQVCLGSNSIGNGANFERMQNVIFNMVYNHDLFDESSFQSPSPADYLRDLSAESLNKLYEDRHIDRGRPGALRGDNRIRNLVHRILPPLFVSIQLNHDGEVILKDKSGNFFTIARDLSGPITPRIS